MVDLAQLMACTGARQDRAERAMEGINNAMSLYEINTPARMGMFLANVGHESGGFHWPEELWGPTPAQRRYEGRADLGNTRQGDGAMFRGRGWLQTTGRANYRRLTERLRMRFPDLGSPDFEAQPELLTRPEWAAISATDFWDMKDLNDLADANRFTDVCKKINGGLNGIEERTRLWAAAQKALA